MAEDSDVVITGTILWCDHMASILFYLWFTFFCVSMKFPLDWDIKLESLNTPTYESTLVGFLYTLIKFIRYVT